VVPETRDDFDSRCAFVREEFDDRALFDFHRVGISPLMGGILPAKFPRRCVLTSFLFMITNDGWSDHFHVICLVIR
jgi:hypothetical protein